ncbi:glycoside hydrolase family 55 protein [Streptomyces sp. GbtcB6]|uniref:glycoside hydrolase family 55 protein n=1 Tax=Streptomyces sp. GbtcB6 TaxID=2824751 RepID=UPI001C306A2C|nr:glycoside hydrolase family 55 protein [Streptomyces sp. GbtcB6]
MRSSRRVMLRSALGIGGLAAAATLAQTEDAAAVTASGVADWLNVRDYGAKGDGSADDTAAIQSALTACPPGGVVYLPTGTYATSAPLLIPPQITLRGNHGAHIDAMTSPTLKPLAGFSGAAVILLVDQATGGYSTVSNEQRIEKITIDCSDLTGSTTDGIQAQGYVHGVYLTDVSVREAPSHGLAVKSNSSGAAYSWRATRLRVSGAGGIGISAVMTDALWTDCEAIGSGSHGWYIAGAGNTVFLGCRSEWSKYDGYNLGNTGTGQGSGGPTFIACSTDRNGYNGFSIPSSGNGPINITGCTLRRDGAGSSSGGYAAVKVDGATTPVVITGVTVYPGTDDDGGGVNSPQYGLSVTGSASVSYSASSLHAATAGFHDGGGNTAVLRGIDVQERIGTTSAPVAVTRGVRTYGTDSDSLDVPQHAIGIPHPREHGLIAWTDDPNRVSSGKAGTAQRLYLAALYVPRPVTATRLVWGINTAGASPVTGQNFVGLYDSAGTRLASVGVDARMTATGPFTETIDADLTPGLYWVGFLFNASTMPAVYRCGDLNATLLNVNLAGTPARLRYATNGSGLSALPDTISPAGNTAAQYSYWAALG